MSKKVQSEKLQRGNKHSKEGRKEKHIHREGRRKILIVRLTSDIETLQWIHGRKQPNTHFVRETKPQMMKQRTNKTTKYQENGIHSKGKERKQSRKSRNLMEKVDHRI